MKVKELIEQLQKFEPDKEVRFGYQDENGDWDRPVMEVKTGKFRNETWAELR